MVYSGRITEILTQKEDDWCRCFVEDKAARRILCVGVIPSAAIGAEVELEGEEEDSRWGKQFNIKSVLKMRDDNLGGIRRYLSDGYIKGIGEKKADQILAAFGDDAINVFKDEESLKRLAELKGFTLEGVEKMKASLRKTKPYLNVLLFTRGMTTKNQVKKILDKYGKDAVDRLRKNPYTLINDLDGFGFIKTDAIAVGSGIKLDSSERILAAIKYALGDAASSGNCYLTKTQISEVILPLLVPTPKVPEISAEVVNNSLKDWNRAKIKYLESKYGVSTDTIDTINLAHETRGSISEKIEDVIDTGVVAGTFAVVGDKVYDKKMYDLENWVADTLCQMSKLPPVKNITDEMVDSAINDIEIRKNAKMLETVDEKTSLFEITEEQKQAVYTALFNRISVISGGPGRGKTAISEVVASAFIKAGGSPEDIIMLAPTGRAAQRITESTGYEAYTIHRKVYKYVKTPTPTGEERLVPHLMPEKDCPRKKCIIIDEFSMADIYLAKAVLNYGQFCNIVIVGDADQIPSVGPGNVLRDIIKSGQIPCMLLKKGHRNSGSIADNAVKINAGMSLKTYNYDDHFRYTPCTVSNIADQMVNDYIRMVNKYGDRRDVMLCTAMREHGPICVNRLNTRLQDIYTKGKDEVKIGSKIFRVGDRVMQTKNDYDFEKRSNKKDEKGENLSMQGVFNGEKGTVVKIKTDPLIPENYEVFVKFDDDWFGRYTKENIAELTLAYAITLHKCQGSEAKCMMMGYVYGDYMLLNKSLFYTGETRAKQEFRFYGEEKPSKWDKSKMVSAFELAVKKKEGDSRNTSLAEMIREKAGAKKTRVIEEIER